MRPEGAAGCHPQARAEHHDQAQDPALQGREAQSQADGGGRRRVRDRAGTAHDGRHPAHKRRRTRRCESGAGCQWLIASVTEDAAPVVQRMFDEARRRDPDHARSWVALVDGNNHQIDRIKTEAKARELKVTIVVDFIHVLEYLWKAVWCLFPRGRPRRRDLGPPPCPANPRQESHAGRRRDQTPSHQPGARPTRSRWRRCLRRLPDQQGPLPRLSHRAGQRVADRDWRDRGRVPPLGQRPYGHHRSALGTGRRRSDPQTTRDPQQRRLRSVPAISNKNDNESTNHVTSTVPSPKQHSPSRGSAP